MDDATFVVKWGQKEYPKFEDQNCLGYIAFHLKAKNDRVNEAKLFEVMSLVQKIEEAEFMEQSKARYEDLSDERVSYNKCFI
jgi:phosphosulfolactate phosphohydrolase-like enzyme